MKNDELLSELIALQKTMRMEQSPVVSVILNHDTTMQIEGRKYVYLHRQGEHFCIGTIISPVIGELKAFIGKAIEDEIAKLRKQAGDDIRTFALISSGVTP
jgi:hypothetical protein